MGIWRDTGSAYIQCEGGNTGARNICLQPYDGNVGIGITNPYYKFHVNGTGQFNSDLRASTLQVFTGGAITTLTTDRIGYNTEGPFYILNGNSLGVKLTVNAQSWSGQSDRRIKKNIIDLKYGLNDIKLLRPVNYDLNVDTSNNSNRLGFIAQEILPIIPEMVSYDDNIEKYFITMTDLIPVTVKAIQEQQNIIETLQSENLLLKDQIQTILERLTAANIH
jgi:hypothetical protein